MHPQIFEDVCKMQYLYQQTQGYIVIFLFFYFVWYTLLTTYSFPTEDLLHIMVVQQ